MKLVIRIWIAIGIVIGAIGYTGFVMAQTPSGQAGPRLVIVSATATDGRMTRLVFIKDNKSGACWLGQLQNDGSESAFRSLATAPTSACQ